jgi:hypothetical protein
LSASGDYRKLATDASPGLRRSFSPRTSLKGPNHCCLSALLGCGPARKAGTQQPEGESFLIDAAQVAMVRRSPEGIHR